MNKIRPRKHKKPELETATTGSTLTFTVLTLFPEMFKSPLDSSILKRAQNSGTIKFNFLNIRDFATDRHKSVDDRPYGGGAGMVMRIDVLYRALMAALKQTESEKNLTVLLDPRGSKFNQKTAVKLTSYSHIILVCGHYEGIDERFRKYVDMSISVGDYVLTGGELPAMVVIDTVSRLVPGVVGKNESIMSESFSGSMKLEYPQYTRPEVFRGQKVPKVLISGHHAKIEVWREEKSAQMTKKLRPDLLKKP